MISTTTLPGITVTDLVKTQREFFATGQTLSAEFRIEALKKLKKLILEHEQEIFKALQTDLGKAEFEAYSTEVGFVIKDIDHTLANIRYWMRPRAVSTSMFHFIGTSAIYSDPYGVILNIAPWNYPFQLALAPVIGAIAAGNCVVLKPSELAPATSEVLEKLINPNFDAGFFTVTTGGPQETTALLEEKWDYIFFTGGTSIGRIVYQAAAKNLTPVTLELGGKSPCIVDKNVSLSTAAKRIIWGKFMNAGQTCVAPDYIYVHKDIYQKFTEALKKEISAFYGNDAINNPDYGKIINRRHFDRLNSYLEGNRILAGGRSDAGKLKIEPTLVESPDPDSLIMTEEIFGPLLPLMPYSDSEEVIRFINKRPKPLALYLFTNDTKLQEEVLRRTSSGGVSINETVMHMTSPEMPFGGVGDSGIGGYHGKFSFDTFSHHKAVMKRSFLVDVPLRYPPFNKISLSALKFLLQKLL